MKRNIKIQFLYAAPVLLIITYILHESNNNGRVHRLVAQTSQYLRLPIFLGNQSESQVSSTTNFSLPVTTTNPIRDELTIKGERKEVLPSSDTESRNIYHAKSTEFSQGVTDPSNSSGGNDSARTTPSDYKVVLLSDAAPAVEIQKMPKKFDHTDEGVDLRNSSLKKILVWNEGYGTKTMGFGFGRDPFQLAKCEIDTCFITGNRTRVPLKDFDAILFHFRATKPRDLPKFRYYHQRWIFEEVESASYIYQDIRVYDGLFNWTMTFRRDSDIVYTYGRIVAAENQNGTSIVNENYASGKTKMAAWFVSNCRSHSRREQMVKALQKYFQVDIFGKCGKYKCPHKDGLKCYKNVEENYKFYLSFENSICKDYVTEKLFNVMKYNVVPVVYGGANYDRIAPPGSYINALNFPDVKTLANYLKYLDSNDTAYNEYFRWKGHYKIDNGWSNTAQPFCDLCKKLHQDTSPKVYKNMLDWFVKQGSCKTLKTKFWLKYF